MTREMIENIIRSLVQPLSRGSFLKNDGQKATLGGVVPFGESDTFQTAFPFGIVSRPVRKTLGYFLNLMGKQQHPVVLSHLFKARPQPSTDGETIVYSTASDGSSIQVKITLKADGALEITAPGLVTVKGNRLKLEGASDELLDLASQLSEKASAIAEALGQAQTATFFGPQPLSNAATYTSLKSEIDSIKGKIDGIKG